LLESLEGEARHLRRPDPNMSKEVRESLRRAGLDEAIGVDHIYISVREGVDAYLAEYR
jgi:hypothetical protein